jgi:hypothetical protein
MTATNGRATMTASLVTRGHGAYDRDPTAEEREFVVPPFAMKGTATADAFRPKVAPDLPRPSGRTLRATARVSLRLTPAQRWRMRLVTAFLGQSCQRFVADALDRRIEEFARDSANHFLRMLLASIDSDQPTPACVKRGPVR